MPTQPVRVDDLNDAFDDLASVTDLRQSTLKQSTVLAERVRTGDTSKLLATIGKTAGFSAKSAKEDEAREATMKATAEHRLRQQPWYYNGKYLLVAGIMGVLAAGLLTTLIVLITH